MPRLPGDNARNQVRSNGTDNGTNVFRLHLENEK